MKHSPTLPKTQSPLQAAHDRVHALATPLEKAAASIGTSPWWLHRWLGQRGLTVEAFFASDQFKALRRKRAATEARVCASLREGPPPPRSNGKAKASQVPQEAARQPT